MIGIELEINGISTDVIRKLFNKINIDLYDFIIYENEIIKKNENVDNVNAKNIFYNNINYSIIFLNLQLYRKQDKIKTIITYDDFINSNCRLILLITDNRYLEIYFNDDFIKEKIISNLEKNGFNYTEKTIYNDGRTIMSVD
ncbi:MAG: DUF2691 family protein [Bacilli bacterium]|nr:DUF2691 family protein [Bacilli bacterium]